jgi:hypothetical protein
MPATAEHDHAINEEINMALIRAADAAFPGTPPANTKVILGYVGASGHTPHIWTTTQVQSVRSSGRQWWPIWVPPQGVMSAAAGTLAAQGMIAALPGYSHPKSYPVFLDVETSSWEASPSGVKAAVTAFKTHMRSAGYTRPFGYLPRDAGMDWIANWTGNTPDDVPTSLPAGVIGQQYLGNYGSWDYSVFDASLLTTDPPKPPDEGDDMSAADVAAINAHTDQEIKELRTQTSLGTSIANVVAHQTTQGNKLTALQDDVDALTKTVAAILKAVQS